MKKTTLALATVALFATGSSHADTLGGLYVGAQYWAVGSDATIEDTNSATSTDFDLGSSGKGSVWVAIEHPIPVLPNIKARYNQLDGDGTSTLNGEITIDGVTYAADSELTAKTRLDHVDLVFYYEVLDNDLTYLDLGLNVKVGDFKISGTGTDALSDTTVSSSASYSGPVPLLYAAGGIGLPLTGLGVFGEISGLAYSGNEFYDAQAGMSYAFLDNPAIELSGQVGYRVFKLKVEDLDDVNADLKFDGAFAGLVAHF